jgi:adenine C2-methylase RlmN of 23S rRNA A2503 and tRNA A37
MVRFEGFTMRDSHAIRFVAFRQRYRSHDPISNVISLASSIGCRGKCRFCLSRNRKFIRNITVREYCNQLVHGINFFNLEKLLSSPGKNRFKVYFASEGDAVLSNIDNMIKFINLFNNTKDYELVFKPTTLGRQKIFETYFNQIVKLKNTHWYWSVHSLESRKRVWLLPTTRNDQIDGIRNVLSDIAKATNTIITIAYALIPGFNDQESDIDALIKYFSVPEFRIKVQALVNGSLPDIPSVTEQDVIRFVHHVRRRSNLNIYWKRIFGSHANAGCGTTVPGMGK